MTRAIRPLKLDEAHLVINYFLKADHQFLNSLGVDPEKLPAYDEWHRVFEQDFGRPLENRRFFYVLWEIDGQPVGHSNISDIVYGQEAYMHLHVWHPAKRKQGNGSYFVRESIKTYFRTFNLQTLFCQPYSLNPAPNKTLAKVEFEFLGTYEITPGWINFQQSINKWRLTRDQVEAWA
jgi:RimJ/RimL family protein N-acetyltransferase